MRKIFGLVSMSLLCSCATVMNSKHEVFEIKTSPEGATVHVNEKSCISPCVLELPRGHNFVVRIEKEGYESRKINVDGKSTDGWVWGNIVFGGVIGLAVDYGTNSAYDFAPEGLDLLLRKDEKEANRQIASTPE